MASHLSEDLRKKFKTRSMRVKKGDTVKVVRGDFKGQSGKVESVNTTKNKVYIAGVEVTKKDGSKVMRPVDPSNLIIQELDTTKNDKRRLKRWVKTT